MPDWKKIKAEYLHGGTSYRELANKYGVSFSTIQRRGAREKWTDLRSQIDIKSDEKIVDEVADQAAKRSAMFDLIADELLQQIYDSIKSKKSLIAGKGYRDITGALKDLKEIKGIKSELDLKEQKARIDKLCKDLESGDAETGPSEITITISPDVHDFST